MKNFFSTLFRGNHELSVEQVIRKKNITSFALFILLSIIGVYAFLHLKNQPRDNARIGGIQKPFRKVSNFNENVFSKGFSTANLARSYPKSAAAKNVRVNGDIGMSEDFDPETWKLRLIRTNGDTLLLGMDEISKLPKTEVIFNFKCIEGWSQITHWGGVKFSDLVAAYNLNTEYSRKYVGMATPDGQYYVGIDMPSALHPQTLLCYEMNDKPLPLNQGYPLRLIIPVKYGIKSLKRIGTLYFSNDRPPDYWYERGYDYYSGL